MKKITIVILSILLVSHAYGKGRVFHETRHHWHYYHGANTAGAKMPSAYSANATYSARSYHGVSFFIIGHSGKKYTSKPTMSYYSFHN